MAGGGASRRRLINLSDARIGYRLTEYSSGAVPVLSAGVDLVGSATRGDREYPYRCSASSPAWPGWLADVIGVVRRGATFVLASDGERGFLGGWAGQGRQPRQRQPAGLALRGLPARDRLGSGCGEP